MVAERQRTNAPTATAERLAHAGLEDGFEITPPSPDAPGGKMRILGSPLDRLSKAGYITEREYRAGDRYRADIYTAAIDPSAATVDWSRVGGGSGQSVPAMFASQVIADARLRVRNFEKAVPPRSLVSSILFLALVKERELEEFGKELFNTKDAREATVIGRAALKVALASAADVYGM